MKGKFTKTTQKQTANAEKNHCNINYRSLNIASYSLTKIKSSANVRSSLSSPRPWLMTLSLPLRRNRLFSSPASTA